MADATPPTLTTRLRTEREEAWRRYNETLTALDLALQALPRWPDPPPAFDEQQITPVNQAWNILPDGPPSRPGGWRGRLAAFVWRLVGPALQQQLAFNAALVDHLNRNTAAHREAQQAIADLLPALREGFEGLVRFESRLLQFVQQITPLVDTKERVLARTIDDVRAVAEVAQRSAVMAQRELERLASPARAKGGGQAEVDAAPDLDTGRLDTEACKYVGFEDRFRGSEEAIRGRLEEYLPYFEGARDVLDVGCGRGEFLDLLKARGIPARGLDVNPEMVEVCRARGLDVFRRDALEYLTGLPDESIGGLLAVQVVEHLEPGYLTKLLQTGYHKLRPGAPIVLETINPTCWVAFFESYIRDLSHVRPLHPDTLQYLLQASGFAQVDIVYRSPIAEDARLQSVTPRPTHYGADAPADPLTEVVTTFNRNVERLNERLFTHLDYAAVGRKA